jgi:hypothetical protein
MRTNRQLFEELIEELEKEKVRAEFYRDWHAKQLRNPTIEGKPAALEGKQAQDKYIASINEKLKLHYEYLNKRWPSSKK